MSSRDKGVIFRMASDIYPLTPGGIGLHVVELSKSLVRIGWKHLIFTIGPKANLTLKFNGDLKLLYDSFYLSIRGNKIAPFLLLRLIKLLRKIDIDIIHVHSHLFYSSNVVAVLKKSYLDRPVIITCHGVWSQSLPINLQRIYMKTLGVFTLNSAEKVLCYTSEEKKILSKMGVCQSKIEVIPNGIDTDLFTPPKRRKTRNVILWIGRFVSGKRPDLAIKILAGVRRKIPEITLIMIGDGPLKESCVRLAKKLNVERSLKIISFIPHRMMPRLYQMADVLLITSITEGVPRVMLEAMSCEVPIVMSEISHLKTIISGCGVFFKKDEVISAIEQIEVLLSSDELRYELGRNGRLKVVKKYSWNRYVKRIDELYEKLLQE